jgi:apolipoprotein N-acyltransferase
VTKTGFQRPARIKIIAMILITVLLLTLAFAPVGQFYLVWIGLVPWLLIVGDARSQRRAFLLSWLAGTLFFTANMWWMYAITIPGMIALMIYLGIYWGFAALLIRGARLLKPDEIRIIPKTWRRKWGAPAAIFSVAIVWTASEWVRGNLFTGLPWLYLGHTQTPLLAMCQIADTLGAYGVTFLVVLINAAVALTISQPAHARGRLIPAAVVVMLIVAGNIAYGFRRITENATYPGPTVLVVQANYPQDNKSGAKSAGYAEIMDFHFSQTLDTLRKLPPDTVNLAVWSETMLPALNHQAIEDYAQTFPDRENLSQSAFNHLTALAAKYHLGILAGSEYESHFADVNIGENVYRIPSEKRNTAYFFPPDGAMSDAVGYRYDKIHLVPWGEFIPCKESCPPLYDLFLYLGPARYQDYELEDGSDNGLTVFHLTDARGGDWRFVTPICFEDIDPQLCAAMFRPDADGTKRADFIVNITNDGWFAANENIQHLQVATFRSIENRAPTARSVNTGISGFIDSVGRTGNLIPARTGGTSQMQLLLDRRLTFYTRFGDLFAKLCVGLSIVIIILAAGRVMNRGG